MELILAANRAVAEDVGLLGTFGGLGIIVGIILVYIAFQVRGEHRQNRLYELRRLEEEEAA
jgi:hypothetical protein